MQVKPVGWWLISSPSFLWCCAWYDIASHKNGQSCLEFPLILISFLGKFHVQLVPWTPWISSPFTRNPLFDHLQGVWVADDVMSLYLYQMRVFQDPMKLLLFPFHAEFAQQFLLCWSCELQLFRCIGGNELGLYLNLIVWLNKINVMNDRNSLVHVIQ